MPILQCRGRRRLLAMTAVAATLTVAACSSGTSGTSATSSSSGSSGSSATKTVKIADIFTPGQSSTAAVDAFSSSVDGAHSAHMTVKVYPAAQLGQESTLLQDVQNGSIQMAALTTATLETIDPKFGVFSVPYLMPTVPSVTAYFHSSAGASVLGSLSQHGLHGLSFIMSGFGELISRKPIRSSSDLSGVQVRVIPSPFESLTWSALHGSAVSVPTTQLYLALQQGTVQAEDATLTLFTGLKLYEVAHNVTLAHLGLIADAFVVNSAFWNSLSPLQRTTLANAANDGTAASLSTYTPLHNKAVATLKSHGVTIINGLSDEAAITSMLRSKVYAKMAAIIGQSTMTDAEKAVSP